MKYLIYIIFVYILIFFIKNILPAYLYKRKPKKETNTSYIDEYPYQKKELLTKTEYKFYKELENECKKVNYIICPKVRMEDFIDVTNKQKQLKYRGYIKSRHIDFIICDNELNIKCAIELDDKSHKTNNAQKIDELKNKILEKIEIPLYRINVKNDYVEDIKSIILKIKTIDNIPSQTDK